MKRLLGLLTLGLGLLATPLAAQTAPPAGGGPLKPEELFAPRRLSGELSPSGRYIALVQRKDDKDRLVIIDLVSRSAREIWTVQNQAVVDIKNVWWKSDDRLLFNVSGVSLEADKPLDPKYLKRDWQPLYSKTPQTRLYAISREGGEPLRITGSGGQYLGVVDVLKGDPRQIMVRSGSLKLTVGGRPRFFFTLDAVDVFDARSRIIETGTEQTYSWATDRAGNVVLRYDIHGRWAGWRVMGRPVGGKDWTELFSIREKDIPALQDIEVLGQTETPGKMYVAVKPKSRAAGDTRELRIYDFTTRTLGEKIWSHPRYDLDSIEQFEDGRLASTCYWAEVYQCDYFDKTMQTEAEAVRRFFDNERSVRVTSWSRDNKVQVLSVSGPDEPGSLYLYSRATGKIDLLGPQWPRLNPDRLGVMKPWTWSARDGATLSGYLTAPPPALKTSGPLPLIVMPHGGPEVRDNFSFDRWGQAFASRGYLVYQPNFRGSGGFGAAFAEQGYGQWGLRMQEDVIDGVEALIKQGKADPNRICIVGASYGGYVALQGGATRPDLFKCVISRAGLSDLIRSQLWEKENFDTDSPRYQYWLKSIGDPKADADRLKAASPVTYAATYGPPVLLLHGDEDYNVPIEQSQIMEKALKKAGRTVTFTEFKGQEHGGWSEAADIRALGQMLDFVDRYIGPAASGAAPKP